MNRERVIKTRRQSAYALVIALVSALSSGTALAADTAEQSSGFKVGDGRLHPYFEFDSRFDSLVGFFLGTAGLPKPAGDLVLHFRPGLRFELQNTSTQVNFNGNAEYLYYAGLMAAVSNQLSRFQTSIGLDTAFNKDGAVEVQLGDQLTRSDRTQNAIVGVGVLSLRNEARIAAPIHPGGGALEVTPKVNWAVEFFEPLLPGNVFGCPSGSTNLACDPATVSQMNSSTVTFGLAGKYKFLPKTAFLLDANFDLRTYFNSSPTTNPNANILRVQAGLLGLISTRVWATLLAGYGGDFGGSNLNTVIGQAEIGYRVADTASISAGYLRTVQPVPVYGVFSDDRGYVQGRLGLINQRLVFTAQGALDYFTYFRNANRNDLVVSLTVGPSFDITSWFNIHAGYSLSLRNSTGAGSNLVSVNFVRHEALLGLTFHY